MQLLLLLLSVHLYSALSLQIPNALNIHNRLYSLVRVQTGEHTHIHHISVYIDW